MFECVHVSRERSQLRIDRGPRRTGDIFPASGHNDFEMTSDIAFAGAAAQVRLLADGAVTAPALLEIYLAWAYRDAFRAMLRARVSHGVK